jgi:hypothetical protein
MLTGSGLSYKTKQFFFVLIKLSIVVGTGYFIFQKLRNNPDLDFSDFGGFLVKNNIFSFKNIIFLLFLTIINWFLEILKWQNLVSVVKEISFFESLKQSLASLTASLFTPNRIGDYAAKAIYFEGKYRGKILLLNLLSNMAQMGATLFFGIVGLLIFINTYEIDVSYYKMVRILTYGIMVLTFVGVGATYKKFTIRGHSVIDVLNYVKRIPQKVHSKNILLSLVRYLVFSFQFYYLLMLFNVSLTYFDAIIIISTMYLLVSVIPTIFVFDVIVKGGVALYLFDLAGVNNITVLCVTTLMWLFNFVLPSVFGSYYVLNFNISEAFKTNPND